MKTIQLTRGQVALVSDVDYERVSAIKWHAVYQPRRNVFYASGYLNGKTSISMHRFIMGVTDRKLDVDHWNRNTLDNQRENLRVCTNGQNQANSPKDPGKSSRFKGVSLHTQTKRWIVILVANKRRISLGGYETEEAAALAWNKAAKEHHGEFALLNELTESEMAIALAHPPKKDVTSIYRGVSWSKDKNKWVARMHHKKHFYHIGYFASEIDAAIAYNKKAIELYGESALLNTI